MLLIGQFSFFLLFIGHHLGNTYTGTDQNGPNYRIAPDSATVRSCNSWFVPKVKILSSVNILLVSMPCLHVCRFLHYHLKWIFKKKMCLQQAEYSYNRYLRHQKIIAKCWNSQVRINIIIDQLSTISFSAFEYRRKRTKLEICLVFCNIVLLPSDHICSI